MAGCAEDRTSALPSSGKCVDADCAPQRSPISGLLVSVRGALNIADRKLDCAARVVLPTEPVRFIAGEAPAITRQRKKMKYRPRGLTEERASSSELERLRYAVPSRVDIVSHSSSSGACVGNTQPRTHIMLAKLGSGTDSEHKSD